MKKLTAGIFTVLMGLVSVNAADAAVASKGYVDSVAGANATAIENITKDGGTIDTKVSALGTTVASTYQTKAEATSQHADLQTAINAKVAQSDYDTKIAELEQDIAGVAGGELTIKEGSITSKEIATGAVTEEKLNTELATKINGKENAGVAAGLIEGLDVTDAVVAGEYVSAVSETDGKITVTRASLPSVDQSVIDGSENAVSGEGVKTYVDGQITTISEGNDVAIASVNQAISDLDDRLEAEITAEEKARTDADNAINVKIGTVADGQTVVGMIEAVQTTAGNAQTATQVGAAIDAKIDALDLANTYDAKGAAATALDDAKTYAVGKANEALTASVNYTDEYITSLGLQQIASVPVDCSDNNNYCTLTANSSGFAWEVIARVEGESVEGRTTVTSKVTTAPTTPDVLTK